MENLFLKVVIVAVVIFVIIILVVKNEAKSKSIALLKKEKFNSSKANVNLTLENSNLKSKIQKMQQVKTLSMSPCSTDVTNGEISFITKESRKRIVDGTVSVTIKKGSLSRVYTSTRKDGKYKKVPVIITVLK